MISDGDSVARNAFRVALLTARPDDTPLPVNTTQELDPNDILEVRDMAEAIARAEQIVAAPRSSRPSLLRVEGDIFESLCRRPTDDTAGPATPAPLATLATAGQLLRPTSSAGPRAPIAPAAMLLSLPPALAVSVPEDDAYLNPAGRIRSLADVTLDGYRPEPTLLLRARARRRSFSWVLGALLLPLLGLTAVAVLGNMRGEPIPTASTTTIATATLVMTAAPPAATAAAAAPPALTATAAAAAPPVVVHARAQGGVPVVDVNSLPAAGSRDKSRARR